MAITVDQHTLSDDLRPSDAAVPSLFTAKELCFWPENICVDEKDMIFEDELKRDPYSVKVWLLYIRTKNQSFYTKCMLYERSLKFLPCSYKIWWYYLQDLVSNVNGKSVVCEDYEKVNSAFERCLIYNSRMPKIWLAYVDFLERQKLITRTRRTYNAALASLPITQHVQIWDKYIAFAKNCGVRATSLAIFRRYLMLEPGQTDAYIQLLITPEVAQYDEAALLLAKIASDQHPHLTSPNKNNHQIWMELCELVSQHGDAIRSMPVESILRNGIRKFSDEVSRLWCLLAEYFMRLGFLEKARDIYEEALNEVLTVKDFTAVFDVYAAFEENLITLKMEQENRDEDEVDMHIARLENLLDRRKLLLSSVKLRQNPHNVMEWLHRISLFRENPTKVLETYAEAVNTIDPQKSVGRLNQIWINFSNYYEKFGDLHNARFVLQKATQVNFKTIHHLASIWCHWVEMELRHKNFAEAIQVARQAINRPRDDHNSNLCQKRLWRSVKLWALCADVEESLGAHETVISCYEKMISLKVITPQILMNYAHYLEENNYYEKSFKVYEKGISLFRWPQLNDIWTMYLSKFVSRYKEKKLERAREMFEQVLIDVPVKYACRFYILYAQLEESFGLARHALDIYRRATKVVDDEQKLDVYRLYIAKTAEFFGITKTREIFEDAIENLPDNMVKNISLEYAFVERGLGEIDRARAIYQHTAQFCPPNEEPKFWKIWREFEVMHGSEDTFRDMLRVKRSVMAQYSLTHFNSELLPTGSGDTQSFSGAGSTSDAVALGEEEVSRLNRQKFYEETEKDLKKKKEEEMEAIHQAQLEYLQIGRNSDGADKIVENKDSINANREKFESINEEIIIDIEEEGQ